MSLFFFITYRENEPSLVHTQIKHKQMKQYVILIPQAEIKLVQH